MNTDDELCDLTLTETSVRMRAGTLTSIDLTRACLSRIDKFDREYNSFIAVYREQAIATAEELTHELRAGCWRGPLHGIPVALKDLIDFAEFPTTAASQLFLNNVAQSDAEVTRRLKAAGAVIVGKTNLHEFAYGGSGMISYFGVVRNPVNPAYIAGGSSSGAAAAVAAGFCFAAIGTDTAGSIRLPAAYCGVVGLKPTYGLVSAEGVVPLSLSYDHVGPIARTVEDTELVLQAISDFQPHEVDARALRFGLAPEYFFNDCDPEIARAVEEVANKVGAREVSIPVDEDRTVSSAEAFAYHQQFVIEHPERYQKETLRRIRSGESITAAACDQKRAELDAIRRNTADLFRDIDVILTPTAPIPSSLISELEANPDQLRPRELLMLRNTRVFNVLGCPAISVPCRKTRAGLPIGIQLAAAPGREDMLIAAAKHVENLTGS